MDVRNYLRSAFFDDVLLVCEELTELKVLHFRHGVAIERDFG